MLSVFSNSIDHAGLVKIASMTSELEHREKMLRKLVPRLSAEQSRAPACAIGEMHTRPMPWNTVFCTPATGTMSWSYA